MKPLGGLALKLDLLMAMLVLLVYAPQGLGKQHAQSPSVLKVGLGVEDITPTWPVRLQAYNKPPTTAVYQPIKVKAMALDDGKHVTVIVTADVVNFCPTTTKGIYERLSRLGLAPHQVILNASHAHSTPALCSFDVPVASELDSRYRVFFMDQVAATVAKALKDRHPATLWTAESSCDVCINKRLGALMKPNPKGPVDHRVRLLVAKDAESKALRGVLYLYGCHPSDVNDNAFGGDFFGFANEYLEKALPGVTALSAQGMGGDVRLDHRDQTGQGFFFAPDLSHLDVTRSFGKRLADAVLTALKNPLIPVRGEIRSAQRQIQLPLQAPASRQMAAQFAQDKDVWKARWGRYILSVYDQGKDFPRTLAYTVQAVSMGEDFVIVALDSEVFTRIGQQIEGSLKPRRTYVLGYSNSMVGYIPTADEFPVGGYEIDIYYWVLAPAPFAPAVEKVVVNAAVELARQIE